MQMAVKLDFSVRRTLNSRLPTGTSQKTSNSEQYRRTPFVSNRATLAPKSLGISGYVYMLLILGFLEHNPKLTQVKFKDIYSKPSRDCRLARSESRKLYELAKHCYKQQLNKAFLDLDAGRNGMFSVRRNYTFSCTMVIT